MAAVLTQLMQELRQEVAALKHDDGNHEPHISVSEMEDCLVDGIMGLEALVRANKREPFSA